MTPLRNAEQLYWDRCTDDAARIGDGGTDDAIDGAGGGARGSSDEEEDDVGDDRQTNRDHAAVAFVKPAAELKTMRWSSKARSRVAASEEGTHAPRGLRAALQRAAAAARS